MAHKSMFLYGSIKFLCRLLNVMDPARLTIFVMSLFLITLASQRAVKLDKENRDDINKEGERERDSKLS